MKILIIAPTPFFADRGCHMRILEEARALRKLGHEITITTYHHGRNVDNLDIRRSLNKKNIKLIKYNYLKEGFRNKTAEIFPFLIPLYYTIKKIHFE